MAKYDHVWFKLLYHPFVFLAELMQLAKNVTNDNPLSRELFQPNARELSKAVIIAFDCKHGRDLFQSIDHFKLTDVARVEDSIDAIEDRRDLRIEKPVRV
jgi:hypothetical protein